MAVEPGVGLLGISRTPALESGGQVEWGERRKAVSLS